MLSMEKQNQKKKAKKPGHFLLGKSPIYKHRKIKNNRNRKVKNYKNFSNKVILKGWEGTHRPNIVTKIISINDMFLSKLSSTGVNRGTSAYSMASRPISKYSKYSKGSSKKNFERFN